MIKAIMNTETLLSWTRLLPSFQPPFFIQLWTRINSNIFISDNLSRFPWSKAGNICVLILHSVDGANSGRKKKKRHRAKSSKWKRKTVWKVSLNYWLNESRGIIKRSISRVLMEGSSFSCTLNIKYSSSTLFLCKHEEQVASDKREGDIPTKCDAKSAPRKPTTLHTNTLKIQSIEPEKKAALLRTYSFHGSILCAVEQSDDTQTRQARWERRQTAETLPSSPGFAQHVMVEVSTVFFIAFAMPRSLSRPIHRDVVQKEFKILFWFRAFFLISFFIVVFVIIVAVVVLAVFK